MISITLSILVALTVGLVQVCKSFVAKRWLPVIAIFLGLLETYLGATSLGITSIGTGILVGIGVGLSSVGLFEFGKSTVAGK